MNENAKQWLDGALMDLCSIEKIMDDAYLTPVVCFHSQQCVEKTLKAVLEDCGCDVPKTHDLVRLYGLIPNYINLLMDSDLLHVISDLYIETRYPGEFDLMPDGKPTLEDVKVFYEFSKEVHGTIQAILSKR
jgi:HEPN domain-containing protein